jgi:hypothetical protein
MLLAAQVHPIALLPPLQRPLDPQPRMRVSVFRPAVAADPSLQHGGRYEVYEGYESCTDAAVRVVAVDLILGDLF